MRIDLSGQVACVTGAATGIGRATAIALAGCGAAVAVNHLGRQAEANAVAATIREHGGRTITMEADVTDGAAVTRMMAAIEAELGPLDILVNNAGVLLERPFLHMREEDWDGVLAADLKSVFLCSQAALARMVARGSGCIINIASELGYLGRAQFTAYCAAKAGVIGLTKSLAREFAPAIRINGIAPGPTETAMLSLDAIGAALRAKETDIPAARAGQPEEIAATAAFLASDLARFYHGQMLSPNGGALML